MEQLNHCYSNDVWHKKIAVLGNYPPPLGGVSVHIARAIHKLRAQGNTVYHFDTSVRGNRFLYAIKLCIFLLTKRPDIIYYHTLDLNRSLVECTILIVAKKIIRAQFIIIEHNCRHLYTRNDRYKKQLIVLLRFVDHMVFIGHATHKSYDDSLTYIPVVYTVEAAFLPPDLSQESAILSTYSPEVLQFFTMHSTVILANAFQLTLLDDKDLYGFDQAIALVARLKKDVPDIGLMLAVGSIGNAQWYTKLQEDIERYQLGTAVMIVVGQKELWPLIKRCSIFIRPTLSDAESVSVQEALYFHKPVIASDACMRPSKVIVYKTGNGEDFYAKFNDYYNHLHAQ